MSILIPTLYNTISNKSKMLKNDDSKFTLLINVKIVGILTALNMIDIVFC